MIFQNKNKRITSFYLLTKNNILFKLNFSVNKPNYSIDNELAQQFTYKYSLKIGGKVFKSFSNLKKFEKNCKIGGKLIILPLEHYSIHRDKNICLTSQNSYVSRQTELVPNLFSKNEGLVQINELDNILTNIFIYHGRLGNLICLDDNFHPTFVAGECFYPGEMLFNIIEIKILTKIDSTNIITIDNNKIYNYPTKFCKYELFYQPIIQCAIPKNQIYNKNLTRTNNLNILFEFQKNLLINHNQIFYTDGKKSNLISPALKVKFKTKNPLNKFKILYFSNKLDHLFIQINFYVEENIFLTKHLFKNSKYNTITINSLIQNNQFIESYSLLATINLLTKKFQYIEQIKKNKIKSEQLIYSTTSSYINKSILNSKQSHLMGYKNFQKILNSKIDVQNQINNTIQKKRIGQPYFISKGTLMYVNHGDFITKNKLICLLVYDKIISGDLIQGLPKIEQILESRISRLATKLVNEPGLLIKIQLSQSPKIIVLTKKKINRYRVKLFRSIDLQVGNILSVGQPLETSSINPHLVLHVYFRHYKDLFNLYEATYRSFINVQILLVNSIQYVYKSQGITISDKHVEVIIKQMSSKIQITDTNFSSKILPGTIIPVQQVNYINFALKLEGQFTLNYRPLLFGITRTSLATESFLSAASFQETTKILAQAATEGKVDWLRGLKENVIMGKLMPSGTGFTVFNTLNSLRLCEKI